MKIAFLRELRIKREDYDKKFIMRNVVALLMLQDLARKFKPNSAEFLGNFCYHVNALRQFCSIMGRKSGEAQLGWFQANPAMVNYDITNPLS